VGAKQEFGQIIGRSKIDWSHRANDDPLLAGAQHMTVGLRRSKSAMRCRRGCSSGAAHVHLVVLVGDVRSGQFALSCCAQFSGPVAAAAARPSSPSATQAELPGRIFRLITSRWLLAWSGSRWGTRARSDDAGAGRHEASRDREQ
jgi:hypothetical protein